MTSRSGTIEHSAPSAQIRALDGPETITAPMAVAAIACEKTVGIHFTPTRTRYLTCHGSPLSPSVRSETSRRAVSPSSDSDRPRSSTGSTVPIVIRKSRLLGDARSEPHVGRPVSGLGDLPHLVERLDPDHALRSRGPDAGGDAGAAAEIDHEARAADPGQLHQRVDESRRRSGPVRVILGAEAAPRVSGLPCTEQRVVRGSAHVVFLGTSPRRASKLSLPGGQAMSVLSRRA